MTNKIFEGVATALITPFRGDRIDYGSLEKIIERQIECGIDALVVSGTTGEAPTLGYREKTRLFSFVKGAVSGRAVVICGTATNNHKTTMRLSSYAADIGADGLLCVTPYYNKGTADGREQAMREVCSLGVPVILYNIPSRSGVDVRRDTLERLSGETNLVAVKECAGVNRICENIAALGDRYAIYSGNDSELLPSLSVGASGVVSVLSNLYPSLVREVYMRFMAGDRCGASEMHYRLYAMASLMFDETNPAPLKYAMSTKGYCRNELRLPMSIIKDDLCKKIDKEMKKIEQNI